MSLKGHWFRIFVMVGGHEQPIGVMYFTDDEGQKPAWADNKSNHERVGGVLEKSELAEDRRKIIHATVLVFWKPDKPDKPINVPDIPYLLRYGGKW